MLGSAAVHAQRCAVEAQLAGMAGGAGDVQELRAAGVVAVASETDRQVVRILQVARLDQKTKTAKIVRGCKAIGGKRFFQVHEPVVVQALHLSALGSEVVGGPVRCAPVLQVVQVPRGAVGGQVGVGDVVGDDGDA